MSTNLNSDSPRCMASRLGESTDLVNLHSIYAVIIISTPNWVFGGKELTKLKC